MLIIGPLGMYYFLLKVVIKEKTSSFLGALFYLLNIGTVQIFFVPFEMFVTQYGFLPWLFLFATQYLKSKEKKYLLLFCLITLLSTPIAYAATLWYVQFAFFVSYVLVFAILNKDNAIKKRAIQLIAATLAINSFWILPNIYFTLNYAKSVSEANINKLFSPQAFLYNKEFGTLKDILLMKNFFFDWNIYDGKGNFIQLLATWNSHLVNLLILGVLFSFASVSGLISGVVRKNKVILSLFPGLGICLFLLINDNPPTGGVYTFLQNSLPIFREVLRFPDNKVLGLFVFCFSIFFAFGLESLKEIVFQISSKFSKTFTLASSIFTVIVLVWFMLPAVQGNLISPKMRIKIPQEYFSLFNWFNNQSDSGKIANLPIHSFWGWEYYNWHDDKSPSFQGAGFLWFGIKQPLLARDFDRWVPTNEQYYREMSYAIYSQNTTLLYSVIKKYDIHYVLIDKNIIAPQAGSEVLFYKQTDEMLNALIKNETLEMPVKFGAVSVYKVKNKDVVETFTTLSSNIPNLYEDFAYQKYGNYISQIDFSLLDNGSILKSDLFNINSQGLLIKKQGLNDTSLIPPTYIDVEKNVSAQIVVQKDDTNKLTISFYPDTFSENRNAVPIVAQTQLPNKSIERITLSVNKKDNFLLKNISSRPTPLGQILLNTQEDNTVSLHDDSQSTEVVPDFSTLKYMLLPCTQEQNENTFGINIDRSGKGFTIFGKNTSLCLTIPVTEISKINPSKSITKDSLIGMRFSYTGSKKSNVCAVNLLTGGCIKNMDNETDKIGSTDIGNLGIKITLDALLHTPAPSTRFGVVLQKIKEEDKATYQNVSFVITKPFYSATLDSKIINTSLSNAAVTKNKGDLLIPFLQNDEFSKNIEQISQPNNSCPGAIADDTQKKLGVGYIEYISKKGAYCDYFSYQNLPQNTTYGIIFTSKNVKGLPLSVCVSNPYSNHCDIYSNLPSDKEKRQTVFILPPMSEDKSGFTIDVNNFAINGTESVNDLYSIQVVPFPYSWLTNMSSGKELKNNKIVIYPYSFDKGWKAYLINNSELKIKNWANMTFPFLFGTELKNHVKINGWENGWVQEQSSINNQQSTIVIVFLPQYLEYFGFILLIFIPLIFVIKRNL